MEEIKDVQTSSCKVSELQGYNMQDRKYSE